MKKILLHTFAIIFAIFLFAMPIQAATDEVKADYLYTLSNFDGPIPFNWATIAIDKARDEIYVPGTSDNSVSVFNNKGMEIYQFENLAALGAITGIAFDQNGDLLVLANNSIKNSLTRCDFRGEPLEKIFFKNLPQEFPTTFNPTAMNSIEGKLYLFDNRLMHILVTDFQGKFIDEYELRTLLGLNLKRTKDADISGFSVDKHGNMLFTVPVLFAVYIVTPDRKVKSFGMAGSTAGKFNIAGGVTVDDRDYIYVTDVLRCVVQIFDKDFVIKTEFGYRGFEPDNLISPLGIAIHKDKLYITQSMKRGVSVFKITYK